jgi:hypothetical protein
MMWLTWRQHRAQVLSTAGVLLVVGVLMLVQGDGAATLLGWLPVLPMLAGIFWGAPLLARELERGTHRLAWTQSVTRPRWLVAKLGWLGLAVTVAGLALGLMVTAWLTETGGDHFGDSAMFGATGIAAGAWWLFAFLLGASAGGLVRRLLPAMAVTIVVFVVVLFGIFQARDVYAEPQRWVSDSEWEAGDKLVTGGAWLTPSGAEVDEPDVCADADNRTYLTCVREAGYRSVTYYQPATQYWRFQWTETGILLLGAVLLAGPVVYRVLRRPV